MNREVIPEFEDLKSYLINEKHAKIASGGSQAIIRCPWCGDSKDPTSAHLYVGPNRKNNMCLSYNCFLCGRGGAIDSNFFRYLECYDVGLISEVIEYNKKRNKSRKYDTIKYYKHMAPNINNESQTELHNEEKLNYLNGRLGLQLGYEDLAALKIVLNLERFIADNNIGGATRKRSVMDELNNNHIGFLSVDNSYIIERAIVDPSTLDPSIQSRYVNYSLYPNNPYSHVFYAIPTNIDTSNDIHFHIAEGPFDILGLYFNVVEHTGNDIFAAACGKTSFFALMRYFFVNLMIPGCLSTIDIYLDREKDGSVSTARYKKFADAMRYMTKKVKFHANFYSGEKDFGVPADRIIDKIIV